ncbi:MAG: DUF655 domain-containing protein [DPANN group archaeon]|nr:DUF655 domain-containing protein [DPANN group archaeon]
MENQRAREEYVVVLDFLQHGYADDSRPLHRKETIVQAIGKDFFTLLELVPIANVKLKVYDEVYIGEGERDQISYIRGILWAKKLTQTARNELPFVVEKIVEKNEQKFINFFNNAGPISLRAHQLEILPGVGKRHAAEIIKIRQEKPFTSFDDIKARVTAISDPKKTIVNRILEELEGKDRFRLFVRAN